MVKENSRRRKIGMDAIQILFERQYRNLPVGGLVNPVVRRRDGDGKMEIHCCYDNYEGDGWAYLFDPKTESFERIFD